MLDEEIYGLIVALGILLALFYVAVIFIFYLKENLKLSSRYGGEPQFSAYLKKEWWKLVALGLVEIALLGALLLVKVKFF